MVVLPQVPPSCLVKSHLSPCDSVTLNFKGGVCLLGEKQNLSQRLDFGLGLGLACVSQGLTVVGNLCSWVGGLPPRVQSRAFSGQCKSGDGTGACLESGGGRAPLSPGGVTEADFLCQLQASPPLQA